MTELLRKLKNKMNSAMKKNTFPNDEEKCIERTDILKDTPDLCNLVTCKLEPSSFRMDNHISDKDNRRDSEDSLLKFAIHFSKDNDNNSSSSRESDTTSSRDHPYENTTGADLPTPDIQLNSDTLNAAGQASPATNEWGKSGQSETLNDNADEMDNKSSPSEESQSFSSSPQVSIGENSHNQGLRPRRIIRRNHVTIEIEEENEKEHFQTPTGLLESYLYILQFLGISTFRRVEYRSLNVGVGVFLKVLFWVVSTCAFVDSLRVLKRVAVENAPTDKDMKYCVEVGFEIIRCFGRFFFIKLVGIQTDKLAVMLLHIRNIRMFANEGEFSFSMLSLLLAMTTLFYTITKVFFGYLFFDLWTWNGTLQFRAFVLSTTLFAWSSNENNTDSLADEYLYQDPTLKHVVMGLFEGFLDFCGTLQGEAIRDLLILAGLTILCDQTIFEQRVQPQLLVHPNSIDPAEMEGSLRHFKCVNQESSFVNETFVTPFKFIIVQNLLLYAHLFIQLIAYKGMTMVLIHSTVDGLKGLVLFYIGMQLHWKNSNIKKWLNLMSSYTGPVDVEVILGMSVQTGIADLRDNPIGLGSDYFLINETFMVGLFASVGSLISLIFQFDKQEATLRRLVH